MKAYYQIIVSDKNGKVIKKYREKRSRSFLLQWLQILNSYLRRVNGTPRYAISTVRMTSGSTVNFDASDSVSLSAPALNAGESDDTYGLVVGSDSTPVENANFKLAVQILHGAVANKLVYNAHSWIDTQVVGDNVDFRILRSFTNLSGGTITIREIGIYTKMRGSSNLQVFCILRDIPDLVELEDQKTITVIYTLRTTA